jgi:hypothetical protein
MTTCSGAPAERDALPYVEGTLSEFEVERFEEHYFDCPVCLARLQALQAVGQELARQPIATPESLRDRQPLLKFPLAGPARIWISGVAAALLLMGVFAYRILESRPAQPTVAQGNPKSSPHPEPARQPVSSFPVPVQVSQLADLALPAFIAPNLRGESLDTRFEASMKDYANGNCRGAIAGLSQIPAESVEARAAQFYSGVCRMHLGNLAEASGLLRKVADAGDSPQQEAALYYLAQIALAGNDPATAHAYLSRTISLHGNLESRSRTEDAQAMDLIGREHQANREKPSAK